MARRDIARTAVEGGRAGQCRSAEQDLDDSERRAWRDYCRRATLDPEVDEPCVGGGGWDVGRKSREFDDRLNPVRRWLASRVGRPWDVVASEISMKFDRRTLAGRHIIEHVEGFVTTWHDVLIYRLRYSRAGLGEGDRYYPGELYVDEEGILRRAPERRASK